MTINCPKCGSVFTESYLRKVIEKDMDGDFWYAYCYCGYAAKIYKSDKPGYEYYFKTDKVIKDLIITTDDAGNTIFKDAEIVQYFSLSDDKNKDDTPF